MPGSSAETMTRAPVTPGVSRREQSVGSDVEADVLHSDQGARAGEGDADTHFERDLFVGRPLRAAAESMKGFENLGGRSAGIPGAQVQVSVAAGQRNGFIAAHQLTRHGLKDYFIWITVRDRSTGVPEVTATYLT